MSSSAAPAGRVPADVTTHSDIVTSDCGIPPESVTITFVDTYSKVAAAKLYTTKTPITSADLLNDRVRPLFEKHELPLLRILTDRGTEYCGRPEQHDYQLYLAINGIDHTRTRTKSPQTNGIREHFHRTILDEFYKVAFRKKIYEDLESLQADLDIRESTTTTTSERIRARCAVAGRRSRRSRTDKKSGGRRS